MQGLAHQLRAAAERHYIEARTKFYSYACKKGLDGMLPAKVQELRAEVAKMSTYTPSIPVRNEQGLTVE